MYQEVFTLDYKEIYLYNLIYYVFANKSSLFTNILYKVALFLKIFLITPQKTYNLEPGIEIQNWNLTHFMLIIPNKETCFISPNVYPRSLWLHWYFSMPTFILPLQASMSIKAFRFVLRTSECRQQWTLLHVLDIAHLVCVPNVLNPFVSFSHSIKLWITSMTQKMEQKFCISTKFKSFCYHDSILKHWLL